MPVIDPVSVGGRFHDGAEPGLFARLQVGEHALGQGVDKADVGAGILLPDLAHDAFDGLGFKSAAAVDAVLHENQVRLFGKDIRGQAARAVIGAGARDGGVDQSSPPPRGRARSNVWSLI